MARVGVEAGGLAGGWLVGARRRRPAGIVAGVSAHVVAGVGVEAGGLAGGGLVGARVEHAVWEVDPVEST